MFFHILQDMIILYFVGLVLIIYFDSLVLVVQYNLIKI